MTGRILAFFLLPICLFAQDSIALREVVIPDSNLRVFAETSSTLTIGDSAIALDGSSLTRLLGNSPVYFKQNGFGMVAAPAFRGSTAQQTAVIWNGINVNSQFNGLTDFNASGTREFDIVTVRGGGSAAYGTGAIGGTVHLENHLRFGKGPSAMAHIGYGSFNTSGVHLRVGNSMEDVAFSTSISHHYSDNDFKLPNGRRNQNGRYSNTAISAVASWKPGERNQLTYYGHSYFSDRNFSLLFDTDPKTRYRNTALRNMLEWSGIYSWFNPKFKLAHIGEQYRFFEDTSAGGTFFGQAESVIARFDGGFNFRRLSVTITAENNAANATGTDIGQVERNTFAGQIVMRHQPWRRMVYNFSVRREASSDFNSPVLYSLAGKFLVASNHFLRAGFSRSFRAPTFNDLYWGQGGNPGLQPETSVQAEVGYHFQGRSIDVQVTGFVNNIRDMIHWNPVAGGLWYPQNEKRVDARGVEMIASANWNLGSHRFHADWHYAYTISQPSPGRQLIYVPVHKAGGVLGWHRRNLSASIDTQFTGPVHTRSDNNNRYALDGYITVDCRIGYQMQKFAIGLAIRNLLDAEYQVVERRFFPGRNYMTELTYKF